MRRALAGLVNVALLGVFLLKAPAACVDLDSLGNGVRADATTEAEAAPPVADPCEHTGPIGPPDADDSDASLPPFVLAVDEAVLNPEAVPGFDIDGVCTCDRRPGAARDGGPSCRTNLEVCDIDGGIDNQVGVVAKSKATATSFDTLANRVIDQGKRTLLIQLAKYNGLANDTVVSVGALPGEGLVNRGCGDASPCADNVWDLSEGNATLSSDGGIQPAVTGAGYVRDYVLVAKMDGRVRLPFMAESSIEIDQATVYGKLVPVNADLTERDKTRPPTTSEQRLYRIPNGMLTGRVKTSDIILSVGSYQPSSGPRLCTSPELLKEIVTQICDARDVHVAKTDEASPPCDGLSIAFGFDAIPALTGTGLHESPTFAAECAGVNVACKD